MLFDEKRKLVPCLDVRNGRTLEPSGILGLKDPCDPLEIATLYGNLSSTALFFLDIFDKHDKARDSLPLVRSIAAAIKAPMNVMVERGTFEGAGIIDAVGEGVSLLPGTRVIVKSTGTWQEYQVVKPHEVIPIPDRLDLESAAQFAINPLTAWLLLDMLQPNFDGWILVTAGTSAVAKMILRLGMERGYRIISVVRKQEQVEALTALGAKAIINVSTENISERVESLTNGEGVSMAFDAVGGQQGTEVLGCLASGGRMVIYGLLSERPITVSPEEMIFKQLTIESFWLAPRLEQLGSEGKAMVIEQAMNAFCDRDLFANVEQRYELAEVHAAIAHNLRPGRLGKILLVG